jgi:MoaA/NifB/PqqE/SkfB family radical SAM enzyme
MRSIIENKKIRRIAKLVLPYSWRKTINEILLIEKDSGLKKTVMMKKIYLLASASIRVNTFHKVRKFLLTHQLSFLNRYLGFTYPKTLGICLTTKCNLRCLTCRDDSFVGEHLAFEKLYKLRHAIKNANVLDLTGEGECLIYPWFEEVIKYIYTLNNRRELLRITTNGTFLSKRVAELLKGRIKSLNISLNAAKAETYKYITNGDFETTIERVKEFLNPLREADRDKISISMVAHTNNYLEIPAFVDLAKSLEITFVAINQYAINLLEHEHYALLNIKEAYNRIIAEARDKAEYLGIGFHAPTFGSVVEATSNEAIHKCEDRYDVCFIQINGGIKPCYCGDPYLIGDVYKQGFEVVWFGKDYVRVRQKRTSACQTCHCYLPLDNPNVHFYVGYREAKNQESLKK